MAAPTSVESPKQVDGSSSGGGGSVGASAHGDKGTCSANVPVEEPTSSSSGSSSGPNDATADSPADAGTIPSPDGDVKVSVGKTTEAKEEGEAEPSAANGTSAETSGTTKNPPEDAAAATATTESTVPPTYESVEASELYQTALALMKEGEFEDCIDLVERGIDELKETLLLALEQQQEEGASLDGSVDVHPSMAPYYYLYGTALLYKVEEQDMNSGAVGGSGVVVAADAAASSGGGDAEDDEEGQEYYHAGDGEDEEEDAADKVEDLQVAWEFLESARGLLETLVATSDEDRTEKYRADLAQVRLREGDLNRMNGQSQAAVADYQASLEYRVGCGALVGPYDRKVADLHYNLGLLCTLDAAAASASASAPAALPDASSNPMVAALLSEMQPPPPAPQTAMSGREIAALRCRGVYHFWQCCKVLAGQLAMLCGVEDPSEILDRAERTVANLKCAGGQEGKVGDGSAGYAEDDKSEHPAIASRKLANLRADLALLVPTSATGSDGGQGPMDPVAELVQLLGDIQETIDEVERAEVGIQQVTEMKAEITAAAAAANNAADDGNEGHGFGSAAAAATSAAAQPLLAVKKKAKKRDAADASLNEDRDSGDSKRPAAE